MRVLFVHSSDELYGSDIVLLELVRRLPAHGITPLVALPNDLPYAGLLSQKLSQAGIEHRHLPMGILRRRYLHPLHIPAYLYRLWRGGRVLAEWIRQAHIDLIHSNTSAVWAGAVAARLTHRPHVWHIHEIVQHPALMRKLIAWGATQQADCAAVISAAVRQHILQDQPQAASHIQVIYDGVDTQQFTPQVDGSALRSEWGIQPDQILVGMVGRVHTWKGQDCLIEALPALRRSCPQARVVIVGDVVPGMESLRAQLQARAAELGSAGSLIWAGYRADAPQVMAALDILLLASTRPEPFGMVVIEAMASGKPVVASAHGGPLETVVDGESGLLFSPCQPEALAACLRRLSHDANLRHQMGQAARLLAVQRFSLDRTVDAFVSLYVKLKDGKG